MNIEGEIRLVRVRGRWAASCDDPRVYDAFGGQLIPTPYDEEMPVDDVARELRRRNPRARVAIDNY